MDAVELPLPAKVGFGPDGGATGGAGGGEVLRSCVDVDRRNGDVKQHILDAESCPSYRSKTTCSEVSMQKSFHLGVKSENNCKRNYPVVDTVLSLPKQDAKMLTKRTTQFLSGPPCLKRPKLEPVRTGGDAEAKDHEFIPQKIVPDLMQCTSSEKSRLLRQKRISDAKRIDKKIVRAGVRSKYDCFTSKGGLTNYDSGFLGNSVLGMHGLKSDTRDVTKHMEDLSLRELLDGTYKYSCVGREKGKRVLHTKDELLVSVNKACSVLDVDSSCGKDAAFLLSPKLPYANTSSSNDKDQCSDRLSSLIKDPSQTNVCSAALYRPKDVLDRLALSRGQDLDSLLLSANKSSAAFQPAMHCMIFHGASLPPFPWSHSQAGGYRPSIDSGKLGSSRSNSQWQWVRVGCNLASEESDDSSTHKVDDLLQEMETLKTSLKDPCDCTESTSGSPFKNINLIGSGHGLQQPNLGERGDHSNSFQKYGSESSLLKTPQASPKALRAAEILCEMARSTEAWLAQGYSHGTIKWPKSPSEKAMKARKPSSPFGAADSSSGSQHSNNIKSGSNHSTKRVVDRKNDFIRASSSGKGTIRWPIPVEGSASPGRSERSLTLDTRQNHGNAARYLSHVSSQARLEKEYENQQKLRKATLTSSLSFSGVSSGDWNRARNRRI